jgi:hypothetical protein
VNINLTLQTITGAEPLNFQVQRMINAGFTGRDQAAAQHHLDELAAEGIPVPDEIPVLYPVIRQTLLIDPGAIEVYSDKTCAEVEFVMLVSGKKTCIGLGSDHTDRKLEETDIPRAKQICPNLMSATVWPLEDLEDHWDQITMRLTQTDGGQEILYQEGPLKLMMTPRALMDLVSSKRRGGLNGYVIFSGTIGNLTGGFVFGQNVKAELIDPVLDRSLVLEYRVEDISCLES